MLLKNRFSERRWSYAEPLVAIVDSLVDAASLQQAVVAVPNPFWTDIGRDAALH